MFSRLLLSRIKRLIRNDPYLPVQCFSLCKNIPNDEKCTCKRSCKYSNLNEKDIKIIINDSVSKLYNNQTSLIIGKQCSIVSSFPRNSFRNEL